MRPYQKNLEELLQNYEQEDPLQGLSTKTATERLASDGPNALVAKKHQTGCYLSASSIT